MKGKISDGTGILRDACVCVSIPRTTLDQMSGHPMAQSNWHTKLSITGIK